MKNFVDWKISCNFATELRNRVINNKIQLRIMENYKNISVNSEIDNVERVERGLYSYLRDRVWGDSQLLGGFSEKVARNKGKEIPFAWDLVGLLSGCFAGWQNVFFQKIHTPR